MAVPRGRLVAQRRLLGALLALAVQSLSDRMGANMPFYNARRAFLDATGKRED